MLDLTQSHFALFGLPQQFPLDREALAEAYRELQKVVHPDRYASAGEQERRIAMQGATRVNEAYNVLRDPLQRGLYLLELHGYRTDRPHTISDAAFLMEQMALREALSEVPEQDDPLDAIGQLMERINGDLREQVQQLQDCFADPTEARLELAADTLQKMQFLQKLQAEAEALEAELEDAD